MKGWKTIGFNFATVVFGGLESTGLLDVIPSAYSGIALAVVGVINMWLRTKTSTPVFKAE